MELQAPIDILNGSGEYAGVWKSHPEVWVVIAGRRILAANLTEKGQVVSRWMERRGPVNAYYEALSENVDAVG